MSTARFSGIYLYNLCSRFRRPNPWNAKIWDRLDQEISRQRFCTERPKRIPKGNLEGRWVQNPCPCEYQEMHPYGAMNIDSVENPFFPNQVVFYCVHLPRRILTSDHAGSCAHLGEGQHCHFASVLWISFNSSDCLVDIIQCLLYDMYFHVDSFSACFIPSSLIIWDFSTVLKSMLPW